MVNILDVQKSRKEKAKNLLKKFGYDAWLIISDGNDPNLEYMLGLNTYSTTLVLLTLDELIVLVSKLEESMVQIEHIDSVKTYYGMGEFFKGVLDALAKVKNGRVLINNASPLILSHASKLLSGHERIIRNIGDLMGVSFYPSDKFLYELRSIKTPAEIEALKYAVEETVKAIEYVIENYAKVGITEKELSAQLYKEIYSVGHPSFENIVAFGKNTANPHHATSDKKLRDGEIGYIDAGIKLFGMCGDITRAFFTSGAGSEELNVYHAVKEAQDEAIKVITPNISPKEPDQVARNVFKEKGFDPELFSHGLGHPIGVEVHDVGPALSRYYTGDGKLKPFMALTVEPALYFKDRWGIRLEDDIVVLESGNLRLSVSPEEPPRI
ncbi:MAG: M24 family metallopeptidase [Candidatus Njordarchaeia archaeon]